MKKKAPDTRAKKKNAPQGKPARKARTPASKKTPRRTEVARCDQFVLFSDGRIEDSPEIKFAANAAIFGISDAEGSEDRTRFTIALVALAQRAAGTFDGTDKDILDDLTNTLGRAILKALSPGPRIVRKADGTRYDSSKERASRVDGELTTVRAMFAKAIDKMGRVYTRPQPGENSPGSWTHELHHAARSILRETKRAPTKAEIRCRLSELGFEDTGKKHSTSNWRARFDRAGLGNLPES